LTTLMLKTFPKRKMVYVPKAICHTQVPESFRVLFSQRRRWINSTIHNLLELIMVRELCGIFCCSMQFVIFLELFGTVVLPASFLLLTYLAVTSIINQSISIPLALFLAGFFLQAILVTLTSFRITQFFWLFMYVLGLPFWYFFVPLYSFWVSRIVLFFIFLNLLN
jgi:cellulose synthase/poly-beta-1,6-N-acetylglucosamine synthase-like glycosyltransferase